MFRPLLISICLICSAVSAKTPVVYEDFIITASDGNAGNMFGTSVSMDGNLSIIGALDTEEGEFDYGPGAAYIYRFNGNEWVEEMKLMSGVQVQDWFGAAVTIQGDIAVVTSVFDGANGYGYGCAYVYRDNGSTWNLETVLVGGYYTLYGSSVAISGDTLVVGSPWESIGDDWEHQGAAYVYRFTSNTWILEQKIYSNAPTLNENFGASVAIKDNLIIVGAIGDKMMQVEGDKAYIFRREGSSWNQEAMFAPSIPGSGYGACCVNGGYYCFIIDIDCCLEQGGEWKNGATCEEMWCGEGGFANSVSISGDNALVSSSSQGCYLYHYSKGTWEHDATLVSSTCDPGVKAVCIEGDTILAGNHIYRFNGKMWEEQITLQGSDNPSSFADSVAISGDKAIVGASAAMVQDIGSTYIFDISEPACPADVNGDGYVNVSDLLVVIDQWGLADSPADLNSDGIVDVTDLLIVVGNWGPCE